jgi:hypothetical protein
MVSDTMAYAAIHLVLQTAGKKDDVLTIRPDEHSDNYLVVYEQNTINNTTHSISTPENIHEYLRLFLDAVSEDYDGPDMIQLDVPSFPTVVIHAEDAQYYFSTLSRQISMLQSQWEEGHDWPTEPRMTVPIAETSAAVAH